MHLHVLCQASGQLHSSTGHAAYVSADTARSPSRLDERYMRAVRGGLSKCMGFSGLAHLML
jgi:hypothetical protein